MECSHGERLGALLDGELAPAERAACEGHVLQCPQCALELEYLKQMSGLLSVAMQAKRRDHHPRVTFFQLQQRKLWRWSKGLALAASFLFALFGFLLLAEGGHGTSRTDVAWEQAAVLPQTAMAQLESVDPVAQKLLGMRP